MSNINVNTITPLAGTSGTVSVSGSLLVSGNIVAQGHLTFGNQNTDSVEFGAEISSSMIPDANNTYNLGSAAKQWKTIYAETGSFNQIISSGSTMMILTSASISYLSGSSPITLASPLVPDITNTHDMGTAALQFKDLFLDGNANIDTLTNVSGAVAGYRVLCSASLIPSHNTTWDLGLTGQEWNNLYIDGKAYLDTIANQTNDVLVSASLTPNADATYALGTTAKQWKHIAGQSASFAHKVGIGLTSNPINALDVIGSISASGTITGSGIGAAGAVQAMTGSFGAQSSVTTNTAGNVIYAHGNISASGATMAATASFGAPTTVTTNLSGTPLYVHGNASASGLVSAQTMSVANGSVPAGVQLSILGNASASGYMSASNIGASSVIGNSVTASTNISTSLATSLATFSSGSVTYRLAVGSANHNAPEAITVTGNISASGHISASNVGAPIGTFTNITASNISASGTISASAMHSTTGVFGTGTTTINDNVYTTGFIKSDTNISASGTGSAAGLGINTAVANVTVGTISGSGYNIAPLQITGNSGSLTGLAVNTSTNVTVGTISGSGYNLANAGTTLLTASIGGTAASVTTNLSGTPLYVSGNVSASGRLGIAGIGVNIPSPNIVDIGTISGSNYNIATATTLLSASIGAPASVTRNISGTPFYVHGNVSASGAVLASGILDTNVVEQSGTAAEDLTATAKNLIWYANTAQAANITLPDATAANAGMIITIIVGTTSWSSTAFKLGFADSGTCVLVGQIILNALDGAATETAGFTITTNAQSLEIDADDVTAAGGAIGSKYIFTYLEANLVHCMAYGMVTTGAPAPDAGASTTTGTS